MLAAQVKHRALPEGSSGEVKTSVGSQTNQPKIVKLQLSCVLQTSSAAISFIKNGMNLSVSEEIPTQFLAKLLRRRQVIVLAEINVDNICVVYEYMDMRKAFAGLSAIIIQ